MLPVGTIKIGTITSSATWTDLSPGGASGYWEVATDGGIFTFGQGLLYGSAGSDNLATTIVGMAAAPDGRGYRLAGADGSVYAYGDAGGMAATSTLES